MIPNSTYIFISVKQSAATAYFRKPTIILLPRFFLMFRISNTKFKKNSALTSKCDILKGKFI